MRLRTLDPTTLRLLLVDLRPGQEVEISTDELCAALHLPALLDPPAFERIRVLAANSGCEFLYDEFGHYRSSFRKLTPHD